MILLNTGRHTLTLSMASLAIIATACGQPSQSRPDIVQGYEVNVANATGPVLVSTVALTSARLINYGKSFCTGTLIGENTVVTAAHCVTEMPSDAQVVFGNQVSSQAAALPVDKIVRHDGYDAQLTLKGERNYKPAHDIAVISFKGQRPSSSAIVPLADRNVTLKEGQKATLAGFGRTGALTPAGGDINDTGVLRAVEVTLQQLFSSGKVIYLRGHDRDRLQGACNGDSGGPTYVAQDKKWFVTGALSTGIPGVVDRDGDSIGDLGCVGGNYYTDLRLYNEWIREAQKVLGDEPEQPTSPVEPVTPPIEPEQPDEEEPTPVEPPAVTPKVQIRWGMEPAGNGNYRVTIQNPSATDLTSCRFNIEVDREFYKQFLFWEVKTEKTYRLDGEGSLNLPAGKRDTFTVTDHLHGISRVRVDGSLARPGAVTDIRLRGSCDKFVLQSMRTDDGT